MRLQLLLVFFGLLPAGLPFQAVYPGDDGQSRGDDSRKNIYIAVIMAFGYNNSFNSSGTVPAIQLALDLINNRTDLLPGYKLNYILMDSRCNRTVALDVLFKQLISDIPKIGIIGAGCSVATEPTAEISHYYNITQLSCASSSHLLANRIKYKAYFQMLPSAIHLVPAIVSVCQLYRWQHIAIIGQDENLFGETIKRLTENFIALNISWDLKTFKTSDGPLSLQPNLFDQERNRIFFLAMYPGNARTVICEAYKQGIRYPRYTFIIYGWYSPGWWIPSGSTLNCTTSNMESVLQYSIAVLQHQFTSNNTTPTETGKSFAEYNSIYHQRLSELHYNYSPHSIQCFDGVWAFALALNKTITEFANNETINEMAWEREGILANDDSQEEFRIENATYKNNIVQQTMFKHLSNTNFIGISGTVTFTSIGIRTINTLRIFQYRYIGGPELFGVQMIGSVLPSNMSFIYLSNESDSTVWQFGVPPYDGSPDNETMSVPLPVTIVYSLLSIGGIGFSVACLIFISVFRKRKFIKLTSPALNYIIIAGAILMYISCILYVSPAYDKLGYTILCNLQPRVFSLSYSLCFGTILAKLWRVYYVFTNPKPNRKAVKDWHLAVFICIIVCIDIVLIGGLTGYIGGRIIATLDRSKHLPTEEKGEKGFIVDYYNFVCVSQDRHIWLGIIFGYKVILQVAALFLAFGIRKVKVKGLNDSKYIGLAVYIISVLLTTQIIVFVTLSDHIIIFATIFGSCILIMSTAIIGLTFIPQMVGLYKDPTGEKIFTSQQAATTSDEMKFNDDLFNGAMMTDQQKIAALIQKIKQMEKDNEILKQQMKDDDTFVESKL